MKYKPDTEEIADDDDDDDDETETKGAVAQRLPQGTLYFYHPDHLESSTFLTDVNGDLYQIEDSLNSKIQ